MEARCSGNVLDIRKEGVECYLAYSVGAARQGSGWGSNLYLSA